MTHLTRKGSSNWRDKHCHPLNAARSFDVLTFSTRRFWYRDAVRVLCSRQQRCTSASHLRWFADRQDQLLRRRGHVAPDSEHIRHGGSASDLINRFAAGSWANPRSLCVTRLQRQLCGGQEFGTGSIPLECFGRKPIMVMRRHAARSTRSSSRMRQTARSTVHRSATFKTFEQRREKLQSESVDLVWIDERPTSRSIPSFSPAHRRPMAIFIVSYTPIGDGGACRGDVQVSERAIVRPCCVSHQRRRGQAHHRGAARGTGRRLHRSRKGNAAGRSAATRHRARVPA